ncbi:MAG TPA: glycosyltransferase [Tepidisphaeraceae bacterium]
MNYLLVNHVPFGRSASPGTFLIGDMWLEDLRAQCRALRARGVNLIVATPLVEKLDNAASGSFNSVEIDPAGEGFEYIPLPHYISAKSFLQVRGALRQRLRQAIARSDIVQADYGGHPVALGQVVWPLAAGRKRIWAFDGADPFPRLELNASNERNPLKRVGKRIAVGRFEKFCRRAVAEADVVFAHNASVVERFKAQWSSRCHTFHRTFVKAETLITPAQLAERKQAILDTAQPLRLIVAGRQIRIKATDHVLRAMAAARARGADLRLDILGEGEDLAAFAKLTDELKLADCVRFLGTVPYGDALFDTWWPAHVMVVTNLTAEISRNVLLAMARGLALIMYRNAGTDDLIAHNDAAILVPTGDIAALADAFVAACHDRARLSQLLENGLATARNNTLDACHEKRIELALGAVR